MGDRAGSLVITGGGGDLTIMLDGTGLISLALSPPSFDFGALDLGSAAATTITVTNPTVADAALDVVAVSGSGYSESSTTCAASLAAGSACDVAVVFAPPGLGSDIGMVIVSSDGRGFTSSLTGSGVASDAFRP